MVARGGSRGIPQKNLQRVGDWSLIEWKARGALRSRACTRVVMSSDSAEIMAEAARVGCEVPFERPAHLATDTASSVDVVRHALEWLKRERGETFARVVLLEPSAPFTRPDHYDAAMQLWDRTNASLVVGLRRVATASAYTQPESPDASVSAIVERIVGMRDVRRQSQGREVTPNAGLYIFSVEAFERTGRIYADPERSFGLVMEDEYSVEVDEPIDLTWARFLYESNLIERSHWE
jgi:CMP-N-acetylneuraminic acid synthetase